MKYLILVSSDNTRDAQVYAGAPDDPDKAFSDNWQDYQNAELFVGIYSAPVEAEALETAACELNLPVTSLRAIYLGSDTNLLTHKDVSDYLTRRYELNTYPKGSPEYQERVRRFRTDFSMTPHAMRHNNWKILSRACALFEKHYRYSAAEAEIWNAVIHDLSNSYRIISRHEGGTQSMNLSELNTPYETRKVFTFSSDGKKAVQHYLNVRQVRGPLYMTMPKQVDANSYEYELCIFFPDFPVGMVLHPYYHDPSEVDMDTLYAEFIKLNADSAEHFIQELDSRVEKGLFISVVQIVMAAQISPEKAAVYQKAREDFYTRRELAEAEQARIRQEEERRRKAEETEKYRAEVAAVRKELMGWGDRMEPLQLFRVSKILDKSYRYNGVVKTRRQFVIDAINDGYKPEMQENVTSFYGSKWEPKESKPKTEYRLADKEGVFYIITKTEYDFAQYLYSIKAAS